MLLSLTKEELEDLCNLTYTANNRLKESIEKGDVNGKPYSGKILTVLQEGLEKGIKLNAYLRLKREETE